ncbi:hypothetical protein P692DRAFT_20677247, partial [Suillus brevipes Sb2]
GPHSRHAVFVGYPEGTKGYRLRDSGTGAFFTARDVIFDENIPSVAHTTLSDSDSDSEDAPTPSLPVHAPPAIMPPSPASSHTAPPAPRRSSRTRVPTTAGQAYADEMANTKARLMALRVAR